MQRLAIRHGAIATMAFLMAGLASERPVAAIIPPGGGGTTYTCQTLSAGYSPVGAWQNTENWVWDGRLTWDLCVARTTSGTHYAIVRLSAPADLIGPYDRFTGTVSIYLQK